MIIDRDRDQGGYTVAQKRISFCLDQLEKARDFEDNIQWGTDVVRHLTIEEIIGALVSAEQELQSSASMTKE